MGGRLSKQQLELVSSKRSIIPLNSALHLHKRHLDVNNNYVRIMAAVYIE